MKLLAALALWLTLVSAASAEWRPLDLPWRDVSLRSVQVTKEGAIHISGSKGFYARSDDGGKSWRRLEVPGAEALDFRGLAVLGPKTVVLMSAGPAAEGKARLFRTEDGGSSWSPVYETKVEGAFFDAVRFWDAKDGLVMGDPVGGQWQLLRTRDGGKSWSAVKAVMPPLASGELAFAASNSALILGGHAQAWIVSGGVEKGRIFRSSDQGRTWRVSETPIRGGPTSGVFGGLALGRGGLALVGGDHKDERRGDIAYSPDGGVGFSPSMIVVWPSGLLESVARQDAKTLIAVGPRGTAISRDPGSSWEGVDGEAFHAIACTKRRCVAVGPNGRVATWVSARAGARAFVRY